MFTKLKNKNYATIKFNHALCRPWCDRKLVMKTAKQQAIEKAKNTIIVIRYYDTIKNNRHLQLIKFLRYNK